MDWHKVVADLTRAGMSHYHQAKEISVTRKTIENWANNVCEPPYSKAMKLLDIHKTIINTT